MPTLQQALASFSEALPEPYPLNGKHGQQQSSDGIPGGLASNGPTSRTTGQAVTLSAVAVSGTGLQHGAGIAVVFPASKAEALHLLLEQPDKVAQAAVTTWLPPHIAQWLSYLENSPRDLTGKLLKPVPPPPLSPACAERLKQCLWMVTKASRQASSSPNEVIEAIRVAMIELPFRTTSSEEHYSLTLKVWADAVMGYPLYAVQKAARMWSRGARDGDKLEYFLKDVRLYSGHRVTERKELLERLLAEYGENQEHANKLESEMNGRL